MIVKKENRSSTLTIPFVIDNQQHKMAGVLNDLLAQHKGHSLDVATAYFNVGGWQLLREGLNGLGNFRLLLGAGIATHIVTQESLGRDEFDSSDVLDADNLLVD